MSNLAKAIAITAKAFEKKMDKGGKPYILHCLRVMYAIQHLGEEAMQAAVMHDLIEDCPQEWSYERLIDQGFSYMVVETVSQLTHDKSESYDDYIKRIATHPWAKEIKKADLRDNSDITRMKDVRKKDFDRLEKYHRSYKYLSD